MCGKHYGIINNYNIFPLAYVKVLVELNCSFLSSTVQTLLGTDLKT